MRTIDNHVEVSTISRPPRVAFLINEDTSPDQFLQIIKYCSNTLAGITQLFIPYNNELSSSWLSVAQSYDPDFAVIDRTPIGIEFAKALNVFNSFDISAFYKYEEWIPHICDPVIKNIFLARLPKASKFSLSSGDVIGIHIDETETYSTLASLIYGVPDGIVKKRILTEGIRPSLQQFEEYLKFLDMVLGNQELNKGYYQTLIGSTMHGIKRSSRSHEYFHLGYGNVLNLVLIRRDNIQDMCLFWNLRALSVSRRIIPVLIDDYLSVDNQSLLVDWIKRNFPFVSHINLFASTRDTADRVLHLFKSGNEFTSAYVFYEDFSLLGDYKFKTWSSKKKTRMLISDRFISLPAQQLDRGIDPEYGSSWISDHVIKETKLNGLSYWFPADFQPRKSEAFIVEGRIRTNSVDWRFSRDSYSTVAKSEDDYTDIQIISSNVLLSSYLRRFGYTLNASNTTKYYNGIEEIVGDIDKIYHLFLDCADMLHSVSWSAPVPGKSKGRKLRNSYTLDQLHQFNKDNISKESLDNIVAFHLKDRLFKRGFEVDCKRCQYPNWLPIDQLTEISNCQGCGDSIQIPIRERFAFRINELVSLGIKEGMIPVVLGAVKLKQMARDSFAFFIGAELHTDDGWAGEFDVIAIVDGKIVVCEAKQSLPKSDRDTNNLMDQYYKNIELGINIGAELVVLATFDNDVPKSISHFQRAPQRDKCVSYIFNREALTTGILNLDSSEGGADDFEQVSISLENLTLNRSSLEFFSLSHSRTGEFRFGF